MSSDVASNQARAQLARRGWATDSDQVALPIHDLERVRTDRDVRAAARVAALIEGDPQARAVVNAWDVEQAAAKRAAAEPEVMDDATLEGIARMTLDDIAERRRTNTDGGTR